MKVDPEFFFSPTENSLISRNQGDWTDWSSAVFDVARSATVCSGFALKNWILIVFDYFCADVVPLLVQLAKNQAAYRPNFGT